MIRERLEQIRARISEVCREAGRKPSEITLIGATKYATLEQIREAIASGLKDIGESRVQDARDKFEALGEQLKGVRRHMIGHLQSNKVKPALEIFDTIHSVDSAHLIREIEPRAAELDRSVGILVEVNVSGEEKKFGVKPDEALFLVDAVVRCRNVIFNGLMTIAPYTNDKEVIRRCFRGLRDVGEEIKKEFSGEKQVVMKHLSMGMSQDYEIAIEEGATMLRIGSAIFAREDGRA